MTIEPPRAPIRPPRRPPARQGVRLLSLLPMKLAALASPASPVLRAVAGLAAALAVAAGAPHPAAAAVDFVVVVNAANPQTALAAAEVSNLFLQKTHSWGSGEHVKAVDLPESSAARESFSKAVHGRPTAAVKAYWQRMIFSGIDTPPPEKPSAAEVLAYVRANPGAIGYVPAGTQLPEGVKPIKVTP